MKKFTSKKNTLLKPLAVASGTKKEEIDPTPALTVNNIKVQRMANFKVLKWNFLTPRKEFYTELKKQMYAANWGKKLITYCFQSEFKFHMKAIDLLIESLESSVEASADNLDLILKWFTLRFFINNNTVLIKSLQYLQVLFQELYRINYNLLEPEASSFIPYLILKFGNPKDSIRKSVQEIMKSISKVYPSSKLFSYIMRGLNSKNIRERAECLKELGSMIELYSLCVCKPSPAFIIKEIAKHISDRDISVRNSALNCVVQACLIGGEKVYRYIRQLSVKDLSLLEERIKQSRKTKLSKHKVSPATHLTDGKTFDDNEQKVGQNTVSEPFQIKTGGNEQMSKHKELSAHLPELVRDNADDILHLLPISMLRSPTTSLNLLKSSSETEITVNLAMAHLTVQSIPVTKEAFAQIEEVLKHSHDAIIDLGSKVDQILMVGAMHLINAHNEHMADENICKPVVISLYICITLTLLRLFNNKVLAKKACKAVLRDLIPYLLTIMIDDRLKDLQGGFYVVNLISVLIKLIIKNSNPSYVFSVLIKLLHDCVSHASVFGCERFTYFTMKCLCVMIRLIPQCINELNIDEILLDIHMFLKTLPSSACKDEQYHRPIRTVEMILFKLVEYKSNTILNHLTLITNCKETNLVNYLQKVIPRTIVANCQHTSLS